MKTRGPAVVVVLLAALGLTGCVTATDAAPMCDGQGRNTLVLMAQSVPEAQQVPCIAALPSGWYLDTIEIKSGQTALQLRNERSTDGAVVRMTFAASCDLGDAVEVPSDEREARRYQDVDNVTSGYRGTTYLLVEGGCIQLIFNVPGDGWSAVVNDASTAFTLASRADLQRYIREYSNGVIEHL